MSSTTDILFRNLADPTRRLILDLLAERGAMTVAELSAEFPDLVTSGISKHLMSLRAARLVSASRQGRHQIYRLEPDTLTDGLAPWITKYEQYWSAALDRLRRVAQKNEPQSQKKRTRKVK